MIWYMGEDLPAVLDDSKKFGGAERLGLLDNAIARIENGEPTPDLIIVGDNVCLDGYEEKVEGPAGIIAKLNSKFDEYGANGKRPQYALQTSGFHWTNSTLAELYNQFPEVPIFLFNGSLGFADFLKRFEAKPSIRKNLQEATPPKPEPTDSTPPGYALKLNLAIASYGTVTPDKPVTFTTKRGKQVRAYMEKDGHTSLSVTLEWGNEKDPEYIKLGEMASEITIKTNGTVLYKGCISKIPDNAFTILKKATQDVTASAPSRAVPR